MSSGTTKETVVNEKTLTTVESILGLMGKYGPLKLFLGVVFFVFISWMTYLAFNPRFVFEKYEEYVSQVHNASVDFRMESAPVIRTYLNQLVKETGADS